MIKKAMADDGICNKMMILSRPKTGKTSNLMQLPNNLIINLEESKNPFDGDYIINIMDEGEKQKKGPITVLKELASYMQTNKVHYQFIILDTLTRLSKFCDKYAVALYKQKPIGKNFKGKTVGEIPNGAGWGLHREAMREMVDLFIPYCDTLVLVAHTKDSSITVEDGEMTVADVNLPGKLKMIIPADCDAIGSLFVDKNDSNKRILSFKTKHGDIITGARPAHLRQKEFVISELDETTNTLVTHWDQVFKNVAVSTK